MTPYASGDAWTLYHGDCREVVPSLRPDDNWGILVDPPWDAAQQLALPQRRLVFTDGYRQADALTEHGIPTWIFVWDCVSSWYTPNRPLRRAKLALWYGPLSEYRFGAACDGRPVSEASRPVRNTRGEYTYTPDARGRNLSDVYSSPITALHNDGPSHGKPVPWLKMLLANCLGACPVILDPFAGTGSGLVAARDVGMRVIGVEIDERQCERIALRMDGPRGAALPHQRPLFA